MEELEKAVDLEIRVWGLPPRDAVPSNLLHAMVHNGSLSVGAYYGTQLVGMSLMFPTSRNDRKRLWSHMAGVDPDFQGKGIGFEIKQYQRNWALNNGYSEICWTFDPLQRGNANFNLHVLGGITSTYHINYYGEMTDGINAGLPSDRVEVVWNLKNARVKRLALKKEFSEAFIPEKFSDNNFLLEGQHNSPALQEFSLEHKNYLVEIPRNINSIKLGSTDSALEWRIALRTALQTAFQAGYIASDFVELEGRYFYVLRAPQPWYLYVLECRDSTLYTGITPDLENRTSKHNAGRGASYTKSRRPVVLLAAWSFLNRPEALKAEYAFKQLPKPQKLKHIRDKQSFRGSEFMEVNS
jgi:chorismate synthase